MIAANIRLMGLCDGMVLRPTNGLSLCAGGGGLDMGLMLAEPGYHTRCFIEWEADPRDRLIAGMRAGYFADAPIWDDVTTFDGRPFRGAIDTIIAGYPCQPFSAAGQRKGERDERHLWPDVARIIDEIQPLYVFLENVAGHLSLGAETVQRALWDMGLTPAAGLFTAAETSAPHKRERWFCVAHRQGADWWGEFEEERARRGWSGSAGGGGELADANGGDARAEREFSSGEQRFQPTGGGTGERTDVGHAKREPLRAVTGTPPIEKCGAIGKGIAAIGNQPRGSSSNVENARHPERRQDDAGGNNTRGHDAEWSQGDGRNGKSSPDVDHTTGPRCEPEGIGSKADGGGGERVSGEGRDGMVNAQGIGCGEGQPEPSLRVGGSATAASTSGDMANTCGPGLQGREQPGSPNQWDGADAHGSATEYGRAWLYPPGPSDAAAWAVIIASDPSCAPAIARRDVAAAALNFASLCDPDQAQTIIDRAGEMEGPGILRALGEETGDMVGLGEAIADLRRMADGVAYRARALRILGNGVVPLVAAYAWRTLSAAHGLGGVDLGTAGAKGKG